MIIREGRLKGLFEIIPTKHADHRGYMARLYDDKLFEKAGLKNRWLQESRSHTDNKNTVRGLHASLPPALEGKTITALRGAVLWVAVDIRRNSSTFGQWSSVVLSDEQCNTLYAERGFAHGCRSLCDQCDLLLRADQYFSDLHGTGILWNDSDLNIDWELNGTPPIISERDSKYPSFREFKNTIGGV